MKKPAKELKKGDRILVAGRKCSVESVELSEIGKQGAKKCRLELKTDSNEKVIIIRPEDYPFELV